MIQDNFTINCLNISAKKNAQSGEISLSISSDFKGSNRKSALYVNEERIAKDLESFWKSIRTKKLTGVQISFGEIDWYDDMTNVYETPVLSIRRGLRKAQVRHREHGSIPKDWSFDFNAGFLPLQTVAPIMEVIKAAIPSGILTTGKEKEVKKELLKILSKQTSINYRFEEGW